jgi:uncharacterized membrane protein YbaN (DUF454 family)
VQIILAWQGFRFDVEGMSTAMKIGYFITILALAVIGFVLGSVATPPGFLAALVVFGWMSYYLGNTLCLTRLNRTLISKWGEERAWHIYVIVCGCMFSMQSEHQHDQYCRLHLTLLFRKALRFNPPARCTFGRSSPRLSSSLALHPSRCP